MSRRSALTRRHKPRNSQTRSGSTLVVFGWGVTWSKVSRTAIGAAWCRLVEQSQPPGLRLFVDPVVGRLLDPMMTTMASADPMRERLLASFAPGTYGGQVMRTRYIDDVVDYYAEDGITQLVILGAGLDTRAFRMPSLAATTVYEADLPAIQHQKRKQLHGTNPTARDIRFVPIDFESQSLGDALAAAGLDHGRPALFVWEGVTQYLSEAAVRSTLAYVGGCAPGSAVVFTYILRSSIEGNPWVGWDSELGHRLGSAEPWRFGLDRAELPAFLDGFSLKLTDDVGDADYKTRYLNPIRRHVVVSDAERVALAVV